jgi:hypothetical protein
MIPSIILLSGSQAHDSYSHLCLCDALPGVRGRCWHRMVESSERSPPKMTGRESRLLLVGTRAIWHADTKDAGTVTERDWAGVVVKWDNREQQKMIWYSASSYCLLDRQYNGQAFSIESSMAHVMADETEAAHRRSDASAKRRELMDEWGGLLGDVI